MRKLNQQGDIWGVAAVALVVIIIFAIVFGSYGVASFAKGFSRSQRLADERNQVQVNDIQIQQTAQLVKVQEQKAQIQVEQAKGIAKAQDIIKSTLTPAYLQYEAIEAQKDEINSSNHTVIYVPSGSNGVPLVSTVPQN